MSNITIGRIIEKLRQEKNYSRKKLCQGLCSTQTLIKIENNKSDVDKFMSDILLQRLGKSPDKLEILISKEEYRKLYMRDEIEELIWKRKKKKQRLFYWNMKTAMPRIIRFKKCLFCVPKHIYVRS